MTPSSRPRAPRARSPQTVLAGLLALAVTGCQYGKDRALDLYDAVPISAGAGLGLAAAVRVTPYVGLGAGWTENTRVGMDENRFGPRWWEKERGIPIVAWWRYQDYREDCGRWSGGDDFWWFETRRLRGNTFLLIPGVARDGGFWWPFLPPYYLRVPFEWPRWSWWSLLNVEASAFAGVVGLRAAVSPLQLFDFLAGLVTWDPAEDDERERLVTWPDHGIPETYAEPGEARPAGGARDPEAPAEPEAPAFAPPSAEEETSMPPTGAQEDAGADAESP